MTLLSGAIFIFTSRLWFGFWCTLPVPVRSSLNSSRFCVLAELTNSPLLLSCPLVVILDGSLWKTWQERERERGKPHEPDTQGMEAEPGYGSMYMHVDSRGWGCSTSSPRECSESLVWCFGETSLSAALHLSGAKHQTSFIFNDWPCVCRTQLHKNIIILTLS